MGGVRVLIVEDNVELAETFQRWLSEDYEVDIATNGDAGLDRLDNDIDVVLLDRRMPGISGDTVLDEIKRCDHQPKVAMVTAVEPDLDIVSLGFDDYLLKPIAKDELRQTVADLLDRDDLDRQIQTQLSVSAAQRTLHTELLPEDDAFRDIEPDELTPTTLMSRVDEHVLPPVVSELTDEYERKIGHRDRFLFQWLHVVFPFFTLSSVPEEYRERTRADKTLSSLFVTLLDDIGEHHGDRITLSSMVSLVEERTADGRPPDVDNIVYLDVAESVWSTLWERLKEAPRFEEFRDIIIYDIEQVIHSIKYSMLINDHPVMANTREVEAIGAHNMMMLTYADIDLMYSPEFDIDELDELRQLIITLQRMARIGNWVTTWERELREGDVSAGVFTKAVETGIVSVEELEQARTDPTVQDSIERAIKDNYVEESLLEQWEEYYAGIKANDPQLESVDVDGLLQGMEQVMAFHLASRGRK